MKIRTADFVKSGTKPEHFPETEFPEFAFAGRSNVGKSSLMNTLLHRKALVKVSRTPGRTQLLNWFTVNDTYMFCDLPGYGFAKVPDSVRRHWGSMIETYLTERTPLHGLVVLTDVRRGFEPDDMQLIEACPQFGVQPILVVTKCDKLKPNKLYGRKQAIAKELQTKTSDIVWFSSHTGDGRNDLWRRIQLLSGL